MELKFDKKDMKYCYQSAFAEGIRYAVTRKVDIDVALHTPHYQDEAIPYFERYLNFLIEATPRKGDD